MQEQRASVNEVYDKKKSQNELLRKVWVLDFPLMPRSDHVASNVRNAIFNVITQNSSSELLISLSAMGVFRGEAAGAAPQSTIFCSV